MLLTCCLFLIFVLFVQFSHIVWNSMNNNNNNDVNINTIEVRSEGGLLLFKGQAEDYDQALALAVSSLESELGAQQNVSSFQLCRGNGEIVQRGERRREGDDRVFYLRNVKGQSENSVETFHNSNNDNKRERKGFNVIVYGDEEEVFSGHVESYDEARQRAAEKAGLCADDVELCFEQGEVIQKGQQKRENDDSVLSLKRKVAEEGKEEMGGRNPVSGSFVV